MNIKQLEVFLAVAESGSFSKGAEATYLTQSTVSQHISALEREFGLKLLDRTGKGAVTTEAGKILQRQAKTILSSVRETEQLLMRFKGLEEAVLRVGGSTIPADYMIPDILPLLIGRYPGLTITLTQGDSRDILNKLVAEEIELGIVGNVFASDGIDYAPLGHDTIILVTGRAHPWSQRGTLSLSELPEEAFILREPGSGTGKSVEEALAGIGVDIRKLAIKAYLGSNEAVKRAVAAGLGASFVSEQSVRNELERGDLKEVKVEGLAVFRQFYIATRSNREISPPARMFIDVMMEIYGSNGQDRPKA